MGLIRDVFDITGDQARAERMTKIQEAQEARRAKEFQDAQDYNNLVQAVHLAKLGTGTPQFKKFMETTGPRYGISGAEWLPDGGLAFKTPEGNYWSPGGGQAAMQDVQGLPMAAPGAHPTEPARPTHYLPPENVQSLLKIAQHAYRTSDDVAPGRERRIGYPSMGATIQGPPDPLLDARKRLLGAQTAYYGSGRTPDTQRDTVLQDFLDILKGRYGEEFLDTEEFDEAMRRFNTLREKYPGKRASWYYDMALGAPAGEQQTPAGPEDLIRDAAAERRQGAGEAQAATAREATPEVGQGRGAISGAEYTARHKAAELRRLPDDAARVAAWNALAPEEQVRIYGYMPDDMKAILPNPYEQSGGGTRRMPTPQGRGFDMRSILRSIFPSRPGAHGSSAPPVRGAHGGHVRMLPARGG